jgi:enoyl-CoA hydratase/carnithine racemase
VPYTEIELATGGAVATVTLNRPAALNAITPTMLDELGTAFAALGGDPGIRVVVLTGAGRAFSAGVDLKALGDRSLEGGSVGDLLDLPARRLIRLMRTIDPVVIAAVNGFCFTGALEIALAADIVVVAQEAKLADTHATFGLRPTWGMSQRLPHAVGPARARWLSLTARQFTGADAERWGLAAVACPRDELVETVGELADTLVAQSAGSLRAYKDLYRQYDEQIATGLAYEEQTAYAIADTEERIGQFR